jgi:hypothetical protein
MLVISVVVFVGGFAVSRIHGFFGSEKREQYSDYALGDSKPFNPKHLVYEVFGPPGTVADVSYFDANSEPQQIEHVLLPWSLHITTNLAAVTGNIAVQGDSDSIGCRIIVDNVVKAERSCTAVNAFTFCIVKAA